MSVAKKQKVANKLEGLAQLSTIVADTGDFQSIQQYKPTDATTNPSLIYAAVTMPQYKHLVTKAIAEAKEKGSDSLSEEELLADIMDRVAVNVGLEILKIVPGKVSTELDAHLSFDTDASVERAKRIAKLYEEAGIDVGERVLIKIASTWEGIKAGEQLEKLGIHCNLTLLFSFCQAVACAEANCTLISPFVGRIMDWHKKQSGTDSYEPHEDPGVISVTRIYNYYKKHGYKTVVMGASYRNSGEILELSGCDKLTIGPKFLEELKQMTGEVSAKLTVETANKVGEDKKDTMTESQFRWQLNQDAMATEKLAEGIRKFSDDLVKLQNLIKQNM